MGYLATKKICLNSDKSKVVSCSSKDAAHTLAEEGDIVPGELAIRYGLWGPTEPEKEEKQVGAPAENKAVAPSENKAKK